MRQKIKKTSIPNKGKTGDGTPEKYLVVIAVNWIRIMKIKAPNPSSGLIRIAKRKIKNGAASKPIHPNCQMITAIVTPAIIAITRNRIDNQLSLDVGRLRSEEKTGRSNFITRQSTL